MKNLKMFLVIVISFTFFSARVDAAICDNEDVARLKELASYVDYSYESLEEDGVYNSFNVFISGLNDEIYLKRDNGDTYYSDGSGENIYYSKMENGVLNLIVSSDEKNVFQIYSVKCNVLLRDITLDIPKFNLYSLREECKKLEQYQLDVCAKDYQGDISNEYFESVVAKYLSSGSEEVNFFDKVVNYFTSNYLIIIGIVFLIIMAVILGIRHRKRSVLE